MRNGSDPCGKIFIAGTGRSGTTHLGKLLGMHPQIYHIPVESRFIVDEGGLEDLVERLTARYTPNHGELLKILLTENRDVRARGEDVQGHVRKRTAWT